jgi:presenilin-like A22 family membrane protease
VRALAAATVAIELAYPAALFSRRAALVLVPAALAMVVGIRALMGPSFGPLAAAHVFWIPWSVVLARRSVPNGADRPARSRV